MICCHKLTFLDHKYELRAVMHRYFWTAPEASPVRRMQSLTRTQLEGLRWSMRSNPHSRKHALKPFLVPISWLLLLEIPQFLWVNKKKKNLNIKTLYYSELTDYFLISLFVLMKAGGPNWVVPLGRRDSKGASLSGSNNNIPAPNNTFQTILTKFKLKGLDIVDLVALSGTLSLSHIYILWYQQLTSFLFTW